MSDVEFSENENQLSVYIYCTFQKHVDPELQNLARFYVFVCHQHNYNLTTHEL